MTEEEKELAQEKAKDKAKILYATGKKVAKETTEKAVSKAEQLKEVVEEKVQEYEESDDFDEETKKKDILIGLGFVIFCGVLLVTLVGSLFGKSPITDTDLIHLIGKEYQFIQSTYGNPNQMTPMGNATIWTYTDATLGLTSSGRVDVVMLMGNSSQILAGCTLSDSLKEIKSTLKKLDGEYLGQTSDGHEFVFYHDKTKFLMVCQENNNILQSMSISHY